MSPGRRVLFGPDSRPEMTFPSFRFVANPLSALAGPGAAGQNKQHSITKNTAKLDRETEELHHDRVTLEVGKVIQQGRQSKGLTQKDLATVSRPGPLPQGRCSESACWLRASVLLPLPGKPREASRNFSHVWHGFEHVQTPELLSTWPLLPCCHKGGAPQPLTVWRSFVALPH